MTSRTIEMSNNLIFDAHSKNLHYHYTLNTNIKKKK